MHEGDGDRAFADRGGHAFDVAAANISDGEDRGEARLEQKWRARQPPARALEILARQVRSGLDETVVVEDQAAVQPLRRRVRSGHHEEMADVFDVFRLAARPAMDFLEMFFALEGDD